MAARLCSALFFGLASPATAIALLREPVESIVAAMNHSTSSAVAQAMSCGALALAIPTTSKAAQDRAAAAGAIDVAIAAMRRFPDSKQVQMLCTKAVANPILFNRENGLRAGKLGGLNLTLAAYGRWMDDPLVTSMGGDVGAYLDNCDENRAILRELGGVHLLIQNIKNNFHGKYNEWAYWPVLNSLFGLSSGCWMNQDQCFEDGFVGLAIRLMDEHTGEQKIAEETLQAVKAMLYYSPGEYRSAFAEAGLAGKLLKVLRENPTDRGAVSLACETMAAFVGPKVFAGPTSSTPRLMPFSPEVQASASEAGAVEQLLATVTSGAHLQHHMHTFNFDVDAAYNADADCLDALATLAYKSSANQRTMAKAGLAEHLSLRLRQGGLNDRVQFGACAVMSLLASSGETVLLGAARDTFQSSCSSFAADAKA